MSYLYLSNEQGALITAIGSNANKGDSLVAKLSKTGLPYTAFKASECESADMFTEVKQAVAASFNATERKLLDYTRAETKSLNERQKADRTAAKQNIGARCGDLYKALKKLQAEPRDTERKAKTLSQKLIPMCETMEKQIVAADNPDIKSVKVSMDLLAAFRASLS